MTAALIQPPSARAQADEPGQSVPRAGSGPRWALASATDGRVAGRQMACAARSSAASPLRRAPAATLAMIVRVPIPINAAANPSSSSPGRVSEVPRSHAERTISSGGRRRRCSSYAFSGPSASSSEENSGLSERKCPWQARCATVAPSSASSRPPRSPVLAGQRDRSGVEAASAVDLARRVPQARARDQHDLARGARGGGVAAPTTWPPTARPRSDGPAAAAASTRAWRAGSRWARSPAAARPRRSASGAIKRSPSLSADALAPCRIVGSLCRAVAAPRQPHEREPQPLELFGDRLRPIRASWRVRRPSASVSAVSVAVELDQLDERRATQRSGSAHAGPVERCPAAARRPRAATAGESTSSSVAWRASSVRVVRLPRSARQISALTRRSSAARSRSSGHVRRRDRRQPERAPAQPIRPREHRVGVRARRARSGGRAGRARRRSPTRWRADPMRRASPGSPRAVPDRCGARAARRRDRRGRVAGVPRRARPRSGRPADRGAGEPSSPQAPAGPRLASRARSRRARPSAGRAAPLRASRRRRGSRRRARPERSPDRRTAPAAIDAASARTAARAAYTWRRWAANDRWV